MHSRTHGVSLGAAVAALFLTTTAARGDDWPQFRRDANRTAASSDPVKLPLTEAWTWSTRGQDGHTPLYHTAIAKGHAYFVAREGKIRSLVCADAKTGAVRWRRPLTSNRISHPLTDIVGPSVSDHGLVFVYDVQPGKTAPTPLARQATNGDPRKLAALAQTPAEIQGFVVRAFDSRTGQPRDILPIGLMGVNGVLPRVALQHGLRGDHVHPVPPNIATCPP